MLSVITVSYNSEKTIRRTIESVLNQTNTNIQHIFIDGASQDGTVQIIKSYRDKYEQKGIQMIVISEKDHGIYDAMNKGIRHASCPIIGILNSDDWYEPETSEKIQKMMEQHADADIIMGAIWIHNKDQMIKKRIRKSLWVTSRNFNHPAMFVKKQCYEDIKEYDTSIFYADFDWYLRAVAQGKKVIFTDEVLTNFSIGGISTKFLFRILCVKYKIAIRSIETITIPNNIWENAYFRK